MAPQFAMPPKHSAAMQPKLSHEKARQFLTTCSAWLQQLQDRGRGCRHCCRHCLIQFADKLQDLQEWRQQWAYLDSDVQDAHLAWMFFHKDRHDALPSTGLVPTRVETESEDDSDEARTKKTALADIFRSIVDLRRRSSARACSYVFRVCILFTPRH